MVWPAAAAEAVVDPFPKNPATLAVVLAVGGGAVKFPPAGAVRLPGPAGGAAAAAPVTFRPGTAEPDGKTAATELAAEGKAVTVVVTGGSGSQ